MSKKKRIARLTREEKHKLSPQEQLLLFYRKHPVEYVKDVLKIELVWFQRIAFRGAWNLRFFMWLLGRGLGKTWLGSLFAVCYAMLYPKTKIGIIAPVLRQASYLFDYIEELYHDSSYVKASTRKLSRSPNKEYIEFTNGSFIEGLPLGDGTKIRGRRYNFVFCDEYAQIPEEILRLVIYPMMNVKKRGIDNKLVISGTAYYPWNHYYRQYLLFNVMSSMKPDLYGFVEYDYEDLLCIPDAPYQFDVQNLTMSQADSTRDEYLMENKNLFPIESSGFFSAKLIDSCTPLLREGSPIEIGGRRDRKYVMGIDAARIEGGDNFVIQVLRIDGNNVKRLVHTVTMNGASYPQMAAAIRDLLLKFDVIRIYLDAQGGGMAIYDLLSQPWTHPQSGNIMLPLLDMDNKDNENINGIRIIRLVNPSQRINSEMFHQLKAEMEHQRLLFPITQRRHPIQEIEKVINHINQTKQELLMLIAEGSGTYYKFEAPAGRKKDRAVALALANAAAKDLLVLDTIPRREIPLGTWVKGM